MPLVHTAHLRVRADVIAQFRERLLRHARTTLEVEPGCHRFDIHQETSSPGLFFLYEVYTDEAALEAHRAAPHYLAFREGVKEWVTERTWWFWSKLEA